MGRIMIKSITTLLSCVAILAVQGFAGTAAYAQSETGNVSGVVASQDGGTLLSGAIIRVEGLNRQATTDAQGRFRLTGLPVGTHQATVDYFGSDSFQAVLTVEPGENVNVNLYVGEEEMEEIIVRGVLGSIYASRSRERAADGFKSVIAADAVGQFGDQNIAEALQRMPAVTIGRAEGEGNFVSVRGLTPGFAQVTLNGMEIGTDGEARGTSLQFVGTNMLEAIEITKSVTPDMSANATAGQINIESASAFRKGGNTFTTTVEGSYQDDAGEVSPKITASGTWLAPSEKFGVAYAFNYYDRKINGNEYRNDDSLRYYEDELYDDTDGAQGNRFLAPGEIDNRREIGQRERYNFNVGLEFRPTDQDEFVFHGTVARVHDEDLKLREEWELDKAGSGSNEVVEINPHSFVFTDQEKTGDLWWQDIYNESYAFDVGGTHTRSDWTIEYKLGTSEARSDRNGSARAQWEEKDFAVRGSWGRSSTSIEGIPFDEAQLLPDVSSSDVRGDVNDLSNHDWVRAWFDDSLKGDEINTAKFDITKDFVIGDTAGYLKFGALYTDRSVDKDENRPQYNPSSGTYQDRVCGTDQACLDLHNLNLDDFGALAIPGNSILEFPLPSWGNAVSTIESMRANVPIALAGDQNIDDVKRDYTAEEQVTAGYVMGSFDFTERLRVVGGVRVEQTDFASTGYLALENDDYVLPEDISSGLTVDIIENLGTVSNSYTDVFPGVTVRFTPTNEVIVRGSITRTTARPNFSIARNSAVIDSDIQFTIDNPAWDPSDPASDQYLDVDDDELQDGTVDWADVRLDVGGSFGIGNPNLKPMMSTNYDLSVGWYPSKSTYLSVAVYRKDITDWIASVRLSDTTFADLPIDLPQLGLFEIDNTQVYDSVSLALNGEEAEVEGVEIAFSHTFDSGFFIDANMAFMDSWSTLAIREDELPLIGQADRTANLSVGYQNEAVSLRVSGNHRGEVLERIAGNDDEYYKDMYAPDYTQVDFNVRWDVNDAMQLYFDAINLTDEREVKEWQGDEISGPMYYQIEEFGRTYQLGMRYTFGG